jgi:hypothetical protein
MDMTTTNRSDRALEWKLLVKRRESATQGIPPGKEALTWVTNAVRLISGATRTPNELYDRMLELYPDRINPGSLWASAIKANENS